MLTAAIDGVLKAIRREFGEMSLVHLAESPSPDRGAISTGSESLDLALGTGGLPRGRIVECFGRESSGKTTLALHAIAKAQGDGCGNAAFIDAEHAMDLGYARRIGVDVSRLALAQPGSGEEALAICEELVRSGAMYIVVVDSVAALVPQAELDGTAGDAGYAIQARFISRSMRRLSLALSGSRTVCLFLNQTRERFGDAFGGPEVTPGGLALKFHAACRLQVRRIGAMTDDGGRIVGARTRVNVVRNRGVAHSAGADFDIVYGRGISQCEGGR